MCKPKELAAPCTLFLGTRSHGSSYYAKLFLRLRISYSSAVYKIPRFGNVRNLIHENLGCSQTGEVQGEGYDAPPIKAYVYGRGTVVSGRGLAKATVPISP